MIRPTQADANARRRVFHRVGWKGELIELSTNAKMVRVRRDDGLVLYAMKDNLYWDTGDVFAAAAPAYAPEDDGPGLRPVADFVSGIVDAMFTDADNNAPDSFSGGGGTFGGGGSSGDW